MNVKTSKLAAKHLGRVTNENTVPKIATYLRDGNTVLTIGTSTILAENLGLPVANHLVDSAGVPLKAEEFYAPGSILHIRVDNSNPPSFNISSPSTMTRWLP